MTVAEVDFMKTPLWKFSRISFCIIEGGACNLHVGHSHCSENKCQTVILLSSISDASRNFSQGLSDGATGNLRVVLPKLSISGVLRPLWWASLKYNFLLKHNLMCQNS